MIIPPMARTTPIVSPLARWRRFRLAETDASDLVSAACYRRSKHMATLHLAAPAAGDSIAKGGES